MLPLQVSMEQEFHVRGCAQIVCVAKNTQAVLIMNHPKIHEYFTIGETNLDTLIHYFFARLPTLLPISNGAQFIVDLQNFCNRVQQEIQNHNNDVWQFASLLGVDMTRFIKNDSTYKPGD
jgi:hypothetical protein